MVHHKNNATDKEILVVQWYAKQSNSIILSLYFLCMDVLLGPAQGTTVSWVQPLESTQSQQ